MFDLQKLIRSNILDLEPYRCARDDFKDGILLDANENTHGPALRTPSESEAGLNRYPDPHQLKFKEQIVNYRNSRFNSLLNSKENRLTVENLCLGVGSDESIDMLMRCVCRPGKDKVLVCPPTYGMYTVCCKVNDLQLVKVPLKYPGFQIDSPKIIEKLLSDNTIKILYLASPGNPTGSLLDNRTIVELCDILKDKWNGLVVMDEAYIDFADLAGEKNSSVSLCTLVNEHSNLVVLQTLSKAFGLAGIRLGITYCNTILSKYLNSMKYPYNISSLTSEVALKATAPGGGLDVMKNYAKKINDQRIYVTKELLKIPGISREIGGQESNFILLEFVDKNNEPSNEIAYHLYELLATQNGVVVRFRGKELNCKGCLRISIGTEEENKILIERVKFCLKEILDNI